MFFYILRRITLLVITLLVLTLGPTSWSFASSPRCWISGTAILTSSSASPPGISGSPASPANRSSTRSVTTSRRP